MLSMRIRVELFTRERGQPAAGVLYKLDFSIIGLLHLDGQTYIDETMSAF